MKSLPNDFPKIIKEIKNGVEVWRVNSRSVLFPTGKQRWFRSEQKALSYQKEVRDTINNLHVNFGDSFVVQDCNKVLKAYNVTMSIQEVVNTYCRLYHKKTLLPDIDIKEAYKKYLEYKINGADGKVRPRTISEVKSVIGRFAKRMNYNNVHTITDDRIKDYLGQFENLQTRRNQRRAIGTFFQWCVYQKYIKENPVKLIKTPKIVFKTPKILTIDETKTLLKQTLIVDKGLMPYIALGLFCGTRPNEAMRLSKEDFHFDSKYVTVTEDKSKVKRRRNVLMSAQFLLFVPEYQPIRVTNFRKRFDKIKAACGYKVKVGKTKFEGNEWDADVLRHTYASYTLAVNPSKAELANQMGNTEYIIGKHYVDPILKEVGLIYQQITPESVMEDK